MKAIILSFIFMLFRMTCMGPTEPAGGSSHSKPNPCAGTTLWTAKVLVKKVGGDTCKNAMMEGYLYPQIFYADNTGYVVITYTISSCSSCSGGCFFKIYKDRDNRSNWILEGIKVAQNSSYPVSTITFLNEP